jgi:N-acetylglucosamine kinase
MILCFDIGGSRIKAAMAVGGIVQPLGYAPTPQDDFAAFLRVLMGFAEGHQPWGVAIAIAGVIDPATGALRVANIPGADGKCLAAEVTAALGLPCVVVNDADAFVLAEIKAGAAVGHRNVFGVILGTGVGGGLVVDGKLVTGPGGFAGEWGHGPVVDRSLAPHFPCGCGQVGCLDTVGGARGIERLHLHLHGQTLPSDSLLRDWRDGGQAASQTVDLWAEVMAPPLAMILNTVGVSIVPVGGGLANVPELIARLDSAVRRLILRTGDQPLIIPAKSGVEPGLIGAAAAGEAAFG